MIQLTRKYLQDANTDIIGYGAKDTGEMGGGAASAVIQFAGTDIQPALQKELAKSTRQVGEVVVTDSFNMKEKGIKWICHIISIIKNTPQGAYCPQPEKLADGVAKALAMAQLLKGNSIAFSALATGEGRVKPKESARLMLGAVKDFLEKRDKADLDIVFALPNYQDYQAFKSVISAFPTGSILFSLEQ